jgi:hypothetical protein
VIGGLFMEIYILQYGREDDPEKIIDWIKEKTHPTPGEHLYLSKRYALRLWLHLAVSLHNINQKVVLPLTLWMMLQDYRGLSRMGRELSSFVGLAPSLRSYDIRREELIRGGTAEIEKITTSGRFLATIDNYTHQYGSSTLSLKRKTQYHLPTYTVAAIIEWPQAIDVQVDMREFTDGSLLASVPDSAEALKAFQQIVSIFSSR